MDMLVTVDLLSQEGRQAFYVRHTSYLFLQVSHKENAEKDGMVYLCVL